MTIRTTTTRGITMKLKKRPCKLGDSINCRTEKHGDEPVPAFDIPVIDILLDAEELNELLGDEHADKALFNTRGRTREPMFRQFNPFTLKDKFKESSVTLHLGLAEKSIALKDVTLAKLKIEPLAGGLTNLSVQVQCHPKLNGEVELVMEFMGREIHAALEIGERIEKADKQRDLALGEAGDDEENEKPKSRRRGNGHQPTAQ